MRTTCVFAFGLLLWIVTGSGRADEVRTNYTFPVFELLPKNGDAPVVVLAASGNVRDSSVGNQAYYAEICMLPQNSTAKTVRIVRYSFTFISPFHETLGVRYQTVRQEFAPYANTDSYLPECWKFINPWGTNVDHVILQPIEVLYGDGAIWKGEGETRQVALETIERYFAPGKPAPTPRPTPTPIPTPTPTPPPIPPWSGPTWSAPDWAKPTPTPSEEGKSA